MFDLDSVNIHGIDIEMDVFRFPSSRIVDAIPQKLDCVLLLTAGYIVWSTDQLREDDGASLPMALPNGKGLVSKELRGQKVLQQMCRRGARQILLTRSSVADA